MIATITHDPFGTVLDKQGDSSTSYGYTGEQFDDATGLLYLRARYYDPNLHSFMGRDPWSGSKRNPQSMNGWSYVVNNPTNLLDLTGQKPFLEECRTVREALDYINCVRDDYGISIDANMGDPFFTPWSAHQVPIEIDQQYISEGTITQDMSGCWLGEVPYRTKGYLEGWSGQGGVFLQGIVGAEIVYDFATMEREAFEYTGYVWTVNIGISEVWYFGQAYGLRNYSTLEKDYSDTFEFYFGGVSIPTIAIPGLNGSLGILHDWGIPDDSVGGWAFYRGPSVSPPSYPPLEGGKGETNYSVIKRYNEHYHSAGRVNSVNVKGTPRTVVRSRLFSEIKMGLPGLDVFDLDHLHPLTRRLIGISLANKYADVYDGIHYDSYFP